MTWRLSRHVYCFRKEGHMYKCKFGSVSALIASVLAISVLGACVSTTNSEPPAIQDVTHGHDTFTAMLSNTMRVTSKGGGVQSWMFHKDGSLTSLENVTGTWEFDGETLCTLYGEKTAPGCWALPKGKAVGDQWDQIVSSGKVLQISIVEGR